MVCTLIHPFSRGSIVSPVSLKPAVYSKLPFHLQHIKSSDPNTAATIDPNAFDHDFGRSREIMNLPCHCTEISLSKISTRPDLEILVEMFRYARKVASTSPLKEILGRRFPCLEIRVF